MARAVVTHKAHNEHTPDLGLHDRVAHNANAQLHRLDFGFDVTQRLIIKGSHSKIIAHPDCSLTRKRKIEVMTSTQHTMPRTDLLDLQQWGRVRHGATPRVRL